MAVIATPWIGRRATIVGLGATAAAALVTPRHAMAVDAPALIATPRQTEGPFYPVAWDGDVDSDLVVVTGAAAQAMGQITHVSGRVLSLSGTPVPDAAVEIWQCDANGVYLHPSDTDTRRRPDGQFQSRGRTVTDGDGRYRFRTIRPVPYPGRTPHIHFKVIAGGQPRLVTQMYVYGEPLNARDGILNGIRDVRARDSLVVRLDPADGIEAGALAGVFDIVLA